MAILLKLKTSRPENRQTRERRANRTTDQSRPACRCDALFHFFLDTARRDGHIGADQQAGKYR
jgi:hypothetical protein